MNQLTLEQLGIRLNDEVLEVGFGGGGLLAQLLKASRRRVVGVDISEAMVKRARRRFRGQDRLEVHLASVDAIPLPDASVDKVCSVNNLYFWSHPATGMMELARVLRPGGRVAIAFEPAESLRKWRGHRFGFRLFAAEEVGRLMEQAGFTGIAAVEGSGRRPDHFVVLTGERSASEAAT